MDSWQAVQNWTLFGVLASAAGGYYYYTQKPALSKQRAASVSQQGKAPAIIAKRRDEKPRRANGGQRDTPDVSGSDASKSKSEPTQEEVKTAPENAKKRKAGKGKSIPLNEGPQVVVEDEPEERDMATKQWAMGMAQARQGQWLVAPSKSKNRAKTVKQSIAISVPTFSSNSSQGGADADDDLTPAMSPAINAGGVDDMLEPVAARPTTLRLTDPLKSDMERAPKKAAVSQEETKKQRQNRQKVEERRRQREEEERQRRQLEERQRRTAREARGEPAKNGVPAKAPTSSAWAAHAATRTMQAPVSETPTTNGHADGPLLDTFDAESSASSNGAVNGSTAATSTTEALFSQEGDLPSEEEQLERAKKLSEDESGWATVTAKPKQKKRINGETNGKSELSTPVTEKPKAVESRPTKMPNGKPKGYQALHDELQQHNGGDPDSADSWVA